MVSQNGSVPFWLFSLPFRCKTESRGGGIGWIPTFVGMGYLSLFKYQPKGNATGRIEREGRLGASPLEFDASGDAPRVRCQP